MSSRNGRKRKVLAVASGGGHWVQLLRLQPAFEGAQVTYVTVDSSYRSAIPSESKFCVVNDATRWNKRGLLQQALRLGWIVIRFRPDVVVSTGAAPGYFAIRLGKLFGARTIWIDSIANVDRLSLSGERVGKFADMWLTQWEHLARPDGPQWIGAVL